MILVISNEEHSTNQIIDYLLYRFKRKIIRISKRTIIEINSISIQNNKSQLFFKLDNIQYSLNDFDFIFVRHGHFIFNFYNSNDLTKYFKDKFHNFLFEDNETLYEYIYQQLSEKSFLSIDNQNINKLQTLLTAKNQGIKIPNTLITSNKNELLTFFSQNNNNIITKGIQQSPFLYDNDNNYFSGLTKKINSEEIKKLPNKFKLSLFQKQINKIFEIRTFYLKGVFYSTAIFSQNDNKTKVDFRDYNHTNPNRCVPYQLPDKLEKKLTTLMHKIKLETGSMDILYNGKDYYFLEVNPVGQFGWVETSCNYNISLVIANQINKYGR